MRQFAPNSHRAGGGDTGIGLGVDRGPRCVCDNGFRQVVEGFDMTCVPIEQPDRDGDGVLDHQDVCPDQGDAGNGVNLFDPAQLGCPNLPPDGLANWEGNPLSPNFDGRMNSGPADPYVTYCREGQLQVYTTDGFVAQVALSAVQAMDNTTMLFGDSGYTVGRSGDSLVVAGPPNDFRVEFTLTDCLARDAG